MSKNTITKIEITPVNIKLIEPFVISKRTLTHAKNTVVKIYSSGGFFGTGECSLFRTIHGETQEGIVSAGKSLAILLIGKEANQIHNIMGIIDRSLAGNASIKCAFDMALFDLNAKLAELPLYKFLHGDRSKIICTDMTVSLLSAEKMVEKAAKYKEDGFPALKIKLGEMPSSKDVHRIRVIRKGVGNELPLRIDANQGWNFIEAKRALLELEEYNIEYCEAPLPAGNFIDLRKLNLVSPIPLMGDESVFSHYDAFRMLSEGCIDLINIKLGKSGGILHAGKIAAIAQAAGVCCQVGCFSETRLGISALAHFAMAWENIIYYDMDSPLMQSEDPIEGGLLYGKKGRVEVGEEPGHGAKFDEKFLQQFHTFVIE